MESIFDYFDEKGLNCFIMHLRRVDKFEEKTVQEAGALAKTRDLFCFCAITSLRYSDMASLKRTDIAEKTKANAMKRIDNAWGM